MTAAPTGRRPAGRRTAAPRMLLLALLGPLACGVVLVALQLLERTRPSRLELVGQVLAVLVVGLLNVLGARAVRARLDGHVALLVGREAELARQNADLEAIAHATSAVLTGKDARRAVCEAARAVTGSLNAVLLEPDADGTHLRTAAQDGIDVGPIVLSLAGSSWVVRAFSTGRVQLIADVRAHSGTDKGVVAAFDRVTGAPQLRASVNVPVVHEGRVRAVLAVGLREPVAARDVRLLALLELLASDAALALSREDLATELAAQASTDPLTGLANRRRWDSELAREVGRAERAGGPLALAVLDLDHFKRFNDAHGHPAGDAVLVAVAAAWSGQLRSGDVLARLGGEEFGVLLPGCDADAAEVLVGRLLASVPAQQTASAGYAQFALGQTAEQLVAAADQALYDAKAAGRSRACRAPAVTG